MFKKRIVRFGLLAIAVLVTIALVLTLSPGTSEAQGPGRGSRGAGRGAGLQTLPDGGSYSAGQGASAQAGMGRGSRSAGQGSGLQLFSGLDLPPATEGDLSEAAVTALVAGLQDEYHAYAVYQAVIDQFGAVNPFTRIQAAEAQHIAALELLFDRYGIPVPEPEPLEALPQFDSLADACALGAQAEIANFALYDTWMAQSSDYPDLVEVFTALRDASEFQHLPAFERCAG